ncbi:unnamed protein product [Leptosia nina]|uniref:C2H2-type domain-containing protein n=1 Tax=Leptosia nina TaxID=320188 RepID=A0AAV1JXR5_9NEOP
MDPLHEPVCHACLNSERKVSNLHDSSLKECFTQILKKTTLKDLNQAIQLCFECTAILVKVKQFQDKVIVSTEKLLNHCLSKNLIKPKTSLQRIHLYNISLSDHKEIEFYEVINTKPLIVLCEYNDTDYEDSLDNGLKREIDENNVSTEEKYDLQINGSDNEKQDLSKSDIDLSKKELNLRENYVTLSKSHLKLGTSDRNVTKSDSNRPEIYTEFELSKEEIKDERQQHILSDEYVNAMFKCDLCATTYTNTEDLDEHITKKHDVKSRYICPICKCGFNSTISFKYHINRHKIRYECNICCTRFIYKREVIKHHNMVHYLGDEISNENEESQNVQDAQTSEKQNVFVCDTCTKVFRWKPSLKKHLERHSIESGQKRKPFCEPCNLYFSATANLRRHVRTSSKHQIQLKLRKLKDTNEEDKSVAIKQICSSVNSSRQTFCCPQCDKKFQWYGNLMRHMRGHKAKESGELVCVPCNQSFSSIATYQQHMAISKKHVSENDCKYMCSDCGKRFADKSRLKDHINWDHLKNYVYTCTVCQKSFKTRNTLYVHKQVHQKDTIEHLCDHCGKHFPSRSKLRTHIRMAHSAVASYKCSSCGANFAWPSCLSRHMRRRHKKHP